MIYNDKRSSFEDLLKKDNSVSIHHKNLQALATETFKVYNKTSPERMQEIFTIKEQGEYNLRNQADFVVPFIGPKKWESLPQDLKNKETIDCH